MEGAGAVGKGQGRKRELEKKVVGKGQHVCEGDTFKWEEGGTLFTRYPVHLQSCPSP